MSLLKEVSQRNMERLMSKICIRAGNPKKRRAHMINDMHTVPDGARAYMSFSGLVGGTLLRLLASLLAFTLNGTSAQWCFGTFVKRHTALHERISQQGLKIFLRHRQSAEENPQDECNFPETRQRQTAFSTYRCQH